WVEKTNRFWYRRVSPKGSEFVLVDAEHDTVAPAFDHAKVAASLSKAAKRDYSANELPFSEIEFVEKDTAIQFIIEDKQWVCPLSDYNCHEGASLNPNETLSPDKRWAAFVKDHNLFVRNASTGETVQLTQDGVAGWAYATPLPSLQLMVEQGTEDVKQPA